MYVCVSLQIASQYIATPRQICISSVHRKILTSNEQAKQMYDLCFFCIHFYFCMFPEPAVEAAEAPEPKRNNFAGERPYTLTQKVIHTMFT